MQSKASNVEEYLNQLPEDRKIAMNKLREIMLSNIPKGFNEEMSYGMLGYVIPHTIYPDGYHCNKELPLPFITIASQKNFIALYHMGIYSSPDLLKWFTDEYPKHTNLKLDMGKSCIRFKKVDQIPFDLISELVQKMSVAEWIAIYESLIKKSK
jgi:hypothetical protein